MPGMISKVLYKGFFFQILGFITVFSRLFFSKFAIDDVGCTNPLRCKRICETEGGIITKFYIKFERTIKVSFPFRLLECCLCASRD